MDQRPQARPVPGPVRDAREVRGRLRVFVPTADGGGAEAVRGRSVFVSGPDYTGMEDNDIRGFLDGRFYNGWNQPGQVHVRAGRTGRWPGSSVPEHRSPVFGEYELIRILQRWTDLHLPAGARITGASLELRVERGCTERLRLLLYAVNRDWNPGSGGVYGNEVSIPRPGEVWWNHAEHDEQPWGRPGAGLASSTQPAADTRPMPLASAAYEPGDRKVVLESDRLGRYVEEQLDSREPLRFLLKLSDCHEDVPGAQLAFYSANFGARRNARRRPRLSLDWECDAARVLLDEEVHLEAGRDATFPDVDPEGHRELFVDFHGGEGTIVPTVYRRPEEGTASGGAWESLTDGGLASEGPFRLRVLAAEDPVALGGEFRDKLRHTWVTSGIPEDGRVAWIFISPAGEEHRREGRYEGDYTWSVELVPREPGPWRYWWEHELAGEPERGPGGEFTVRAEHPGAVREALERLAAEIREAGLDRHSRDLDPFRIRFSRLVREAARVDGGAASGNALEELLPKLDEVRSILWGRELPEPFPHRSMPIREEIDGRQLPDPVPDLRDGRRGWLGSTLRRLRGRLGRLRRHLPGGEA